MLHLVRNPEAEYHRIARDMRLEQLEAENAALRDNIAALEPRAAAGARPRLPGRARRHAGAAPQAARLPCAACRRIAPAPCQHPSARPAGAAAGAEGDAGGGGGAGLSLAVKDAELTVARRRAAEVEKQLDRLKAVFKDRIGVFREACALLFGYRCAPAQGPCALLRRGQLRAPAPAGAQQRAGADGAPLGPARPPAARRRVDMTSEATSARDPAAATTSISLHPLMESRSSEAVLQFRLSKAKGIRLVPTPYSEGLRQQVDTFLSKYKSVPAFTANLTMELFNQSTQG